MWTTPIRQSETAGYIAQRRQADDPSREKLAAAADYGHPPASRRPTRPEALPSPFSAVRRVPPRFPEFQSPRNGRARAG